MIAPIDMEMIIRRLRHGRPTYLYTITGGVPWLHPFAFKSSESDLKLAFVIKPRKDQTVPGTDTGK